jgi:hypothetical protein
MSSFILCVSFYGWLLVVVLFYGLVTKRIEYSICCLIFSGLVDLSESLGLIGRGIFVEENYDDKVVVGNVTGTDYPGKVQQVPS